jgi:hypothetical protein
MRHMANSGFTAWALAAAVAAATVLLSANDAIAQRADDSIDAAAVVYPDPGRVTGSTGVHDPSVVKTQSGTYIIAATGDNLVLKTSTDRIAWRAAGVVWPNGAPWTTTYTAGSKTLWAPDISFHNGQFFLYYAASTFGSQHSGIFLATSPTGASGSWTHRGLVIESSSAVDFNAIDPNLRRRRRCPLVPLLRRQRRVIPRHQPHQLGQLGLAGRVLSRRKVSDEHHEGNGAVSAHATWRCLRYARLPAGFSALRERRAPRASRAGGGSRWRRRWGR